MANMQKVIEAKEFLSDVSTPLLPPSSTPLLPPSPTPTPTLRYEQADDALLDWSTCIHIVITMVVTMVVTLQQER